MPYNPNPPQSSFSYRAKSTPITTLRDLKKGRIAASKVINLRGMHTDEAQDHLLEVIDHTVDSTCLLVIHGQGLRSKEQIPLIKERLIDTLPRHPRILALATALPKDGGHGAMYVLLKKRDLRG